MNYEVTIGENTLLLDVQRQGDGYTVSVDGGPERSVDLRRLGAVLSLVVEGRSVDAALVRRDDGWDVDLFGTTHSCQVVDPRRKALRLANAAHQGMLSTAMPGRVVAVLVEVGDTVAKGQPVVVVEAMKMENELKAPADGQVMEIFVDAEQALDAGAKLLRIE